MQVESGIPMDYPNTTYTKYPFHKMAVGDSFVVEPGKVVSCRNCAVGFAKRHGTKFSIRLTKDGQHRCWRIA